MKAVITVLAFALTTSLALAYSGDGYRVCRLNPNGDNFLALRTGPGASFPMVMKLGPDSVVEHRKTEGNWMSVVVERANGYEYLRDLPHGYVYRKYLCPL